MTRAPFVYGAVTAGAIFFIGWITGMGGSFLPNLGFSLLMGVFAAGCYMVAHKVGKRGE